MNSYPKVYIIILNYNGWADTIECLESILRSDYPNYQVIVVDNDSPNNSIEYIKAWAEGKLNVWIRSDNPLRYLSFPPVRKPVPYVYYSREEAEKGGNRSWENSLMLEWFNNRKGTGRKFSQSTKELFNKSSIQSINYSLNNPLILIQTGRNLGFAGGNNVGIRYALAKNDFEYIWLLNNDTVIKKQSLKEIIRFYAQFYEKSLGKFLLSHRIHFYSDPNKIWFLYPVFLRWIGLVIDRFYRKNWSIIEDKIKDMCFETDFLTGCSLFIPKKVLTDVGLFDENIFLYNEDLDYSIRVKKSNYKLMVYNKCLVYHKVGQSRKVSCFNYFWGEYSVGYVYRKHFEDLKFFIPLVFLFQNLIKIPLRFLKNKICIVDMYKGGLLGWLKRK